MTFFSLDFPCWRVVGNKFQNLPQANESHGRIRQKKTPLANTSLIQVDGRIPAPDVEDLEK